MTNEISQKFRVSLDPDTLARQRTPSTTEEKSVTPNVLGAIRTTMKRAPTILLSPLKKREEIPRKENDKEKKEKWKEEMRKVKIERERR